MVLFLHEGISLYVFRRFKDLFFVVVVVVKNTKLKDVYETMCVFANMLNTHDVFIKTKFPWSSKKEIN